MYEPCVLAMYPTEDRCLYYLPSEYRPVGVSVGAPPLPPNPPTPPAFPLLPEVTAVPAMAPPMQLPTDHLTNSTAGGGRHLHRQLLQLEPHRSVLEDGPKCESLAPGFLTQLTPTCCK